jgi:hypothetical protein
MTGREFCRFIIIVSTTLLIIVSLVELIVGLMYP